MRSRGGIQNKAPTTCIVKERGRPTVNTTAGPDTYDRSRQCTWNRPPTSVHISSSRCVRVIRTLLIVVGPMHTKSFIILQTLHYNKRMFICSWPSLQVQFATQGAMSGKPLRRFTVFVNCCCKAFCGIEIEQTSDFKLPPRCKWGLRSSGMLRRVD